MKKFTKFVPLVILLVVLIFVVADRLSYLERISPHRISEGMIAPDFELPSLSGGTMRLRNFTGYNVLLYLFSPTCPSCLDEFPYWYELCAKQDSSRVKFLAVASGDIPAIEAFVRRTGQSFVVLIDRAEVMQRYGVSSYPKVILVDPSTRIVFDSYNIPMDVSLRRVSQKLQNP